MPAGPGATSRHVGKAIFVPAVLAAFIVCVVVGLAHALGRLPGLGPELPLRLRCLFSIAAIGLVGFLFMYLVMANKERALAPQFQRAAVRFGFETEPTWAGSHHERAKST